MKRVFVVTLVLMAIGCGGGSKKGPSIDEGTVPLLLAAGSVSLDPTADTSWAAGLDLARLGIGGANAHYDVTTPADTPFVIEAYSRAPTNTGAVVLSVAHVADGGAAPAGGPETLSSAGVMLRGPGRTTRGEWMDAGGDGFARVNLRGSITRDQVLVASADVAGERTTFLIRVRIGAPSVINVAALGGGNHPGIQLDQTIYSSDSWMFGLPTIAVSGDRSTVVCYEGDRADAHRYERYELRLQHDASSGAVTGGAVEDASPDAGNWRDHEIAALFNVLAILRGGEARVELALSFDRGATIGQTVALGPSSAGYRPRLVQAAMALDYSLAVLFWRSLPDGATELVLVDGRPSAFDGGGSPTQFAFDAPVVIHRAPGDVTPVLMGTTWSDGGDLVVGYAYTSFTNGPDRTWISLTQNRCYVRPFGEAARDTLVEESRIVGRDPSVAVTGQGATLRIFYAYEGTTGIRLTTSDDAGLTFTPPLAIGDGTSHMPTVLARPGPGGPALDVLYLAQSAEGTELHVRHWDDFDLGTFNDYRLTTAVTEGGGQLLPPDGDVASLPSTDFRITQVAWFGYDAVLDGDEIVVVVDEETIDGYEFWPAIDLGAPGVLEDTASGAAPFVPADPPPLAPGLTETVSAPDPLHRHQLRLLRIR